jgi:hypothetical protein
MHCRRADRYHQLCLLAGAPALAAMLNRLLPGAGGRLCW